jgi:hypothetical protein
MRPLIITILVAPDRQPLSGARSRSVRPASATGIGTDGSPCGAKVGFTVRIDALHLPQLTIADTADVGKVLERVEREVGLPPAIWVDQGTAFVCRDLDLWGTSVALRSVFRHQGSRLTTHSLSLKSSIVVSGSNARCVRDSSHSR